MLRIRRIEESLAGIYQLGEMRTPTHFSIGQEATAVGVCAALTRDDVIYSGHRCHAHYLAKGGDLLGMVAELFGRENGCCGGRGGSVHLNDPGAGIPASSAILAETIAVAAGSALAFAMDGGQRVAVSFFGDACVEEGTFHETLNLASTMHLPVVFVCENNLYSVQSPLSVRQPEGLPIYERAAAYKMAGLQVDGNDVEAVYEAATAAVDRARSGGGPTLLECLTYRWREHVGPLHDGGRGFRSQAEIDSWVARCPIETAKRRVLERGLCGAEDIDGWCLEFQAQVDEAIGMARLSPFPAAEDLLVGAY